jgi:hypothetical protein
VPPSVPSHDEPIAQSSLTPSLASLTDRLHVTFASSTSESSHSDLVSLQGTPVSARSSRAAAQEDSLLISPHEAPDHGSDFPVAKTIIFADGNGSEAESAEQEQCQQDSDTDEEKESGGEEGVQSPSSGRMKKHSNSLEAVCVVPTLPEEPTASGLSSPCKRSRSS